MFFPPCFCFVYIEAPTSVSRVMSRDRSVSDVLYTTVEVIFPHSFGPHGDSRASPTPYLSEPLGNSSGVGDSKSSVVTYTVPEHSHVPERCYPAFFLSEKSDPETHVITLASSSRVQYFESTDLFGFTGPLESEGGPKFSVVVPARSKGSDSFPVYFPPADAIPLSNYGGPRVRLGVAIFPRPLGPVVP